MVVVRHTSQKGYVQVQNVHTKMYVCQSLFANSCFLLCVTHAVNAPMKVRLKLTQVRYHLHVEKKIQGLPGSQ